MHVAGSADQFHSFTVGRKKEHFFARDLELSTDDLDLRA